MKSEELFLVRRFSRNLFLEVLDFENIYKDFVKIAFNSSPCRFSLAITHNDYTHNDYTHNDYTHNDYT